MGILILTEEKQSTKRQYLARTEKRGQLRQEVSQDYKNKVDYKLLVGWLCLPSQRKTLQMRRSLERGSEKELLSECRETWKKQR